MNDVNHIGQKSWNRLSRNQKLAIIKNRKSARKLADGFSNERWKRNHPNSVEIK